MTNKYAQIVIGPAGSGKSTYIKHVYDHYTAIKREVNCFNLDPAADFIPYEPSIDVREAITVQDAMDVHGYGPNGGLIFCMEQLAHEKNWFDDAIGEHEYDYLLIDLPGQIELYSHLNVLPNLLNNLVQKGYHLLVIYLLDAQFMSDAAKFLSGSLVALSTMTMLELPHINVLTKCDLLTKDQMDAIDYFTEMETMALMDDIKPNTGLEKLTQSICEILDTFRLVQFHTLNYQEPDDLKDLLSEIDIIMQYYDNADFGDEEFQGNDPETPEEIAELMDMMRAQ